MNRIIFLICLLFFYSCKVSYKESADITQPGNTSISGIYLNAKVCLEGAYLGTTSLLNPIFSSPYLSPQILPLNTPFAPSLNDIQISDYGLGGIGADNWVDWVQIELYEKQGAVYNLIDFQSALVDKNGVLYRSNGETQGLFFPGLTAGQYYINLRTRNHLSVGALNSITLSESLNTSSFDIDFTLTTTSYLGQTGTPSTEPFVLKGVGSTIKCLAAGDVNQDYEIDSSDLGAVDTFVDNTLQDYNVLFANNHDAIVKGYRPEDVNFTGDVQAYTDTAGTTPSGDRILISGNANRSSQVYPIP